MKIKVFNWFLLSWIIAFSAFAKESEDSIQLLEKVWNTAKENIYPTLLRDKFTESVHESLKSSVESASLSDSIFILNSFLHSLSVSHTGLYSPEDES